MKKFLLVFFVVFVANLGCKKLDKGDQPCACSPMREPTISLVVKNAAGADLLNPNTNQYFAANTVQLYYLEAGATKPISFYVQQPFTYGSQSFAFYQINSSTILQRAATANQDFYLKFGSNQPIKLNIELNAQNKAKVDKVLINSTEVIAETGEVIKYLPNIFYLQL